MRVLEEVIERRKDKAYTYESWDGGFGVWRSQRGAPSLGYRNAQVSAKTLERIALTDDGQFADKNTPFIRT